ncbi:MAG: ABC transporter ATP-binding protein [Planctomycetota bacterium]|jgi:ABC-type lipoprotein export system ATPase subunit
MICAVGITKSYTEGSNAVVALDHVGIEIDRGEFAVIMGRSGAGKSTLLGVIGGLLKPSSGEVILNGRSLWSLDERARARIRAEEIGFVFQNAPAINSLTVIENVLLPETFSDKHRSVAGTRRATGLLEVMGLGAKAHAYPDELSGGEKRRIAIASALMNDPPIVLADEPTGDLDSETESQIMDHFAYLKRKGTTIVMVTHDAKLTAYADRVFRMECGTIHEVSSHAGTQETKITNSGPSGRDEGKTPKSSVQ